MKRTMRLVLGGVLLGITTLAQAAWPERAITLVVPFPPGGSTDIVGRLLGKELSDRLGVTVMVENRPGAAGNVGSRYVVNSKADGYTLLVATTAQTIGAAIYKNQGYDVTKDFEAISGINDGPLLLMTRPDLGVTNMQELLELSKRTPGGFTIGNAGNGGSPHMAAEIFGLATGMELVHVPFQGAAPAMNALIGGQVDLGFDLILGARPFVQEKRVQAIGMATLERYPLFPQLPTLAEQSPDKLGSFNESAWNVLLAPKGTPADIVEKLNAHLKDILSSEQVRAKLAEMSNVPIWKTPQETQAFIEEDVEKWKRVVREANLEKL